ncbi:MAG: cytochrome b N-terminal domain-containing protein [Planctomycetaceae bacterium]
MTDRPRRVPGPNPDRWPCFGIMALAVAAMGLLGGLLLAFFYAPTLEEAHASVAALGGRLLRSSHHWCGTLALVLCALHGLRLFWHGCHRPPRHLLWLCGLGIFLTLLGFAYTGYLLAGDERALTGIQVMAGVAGSIPLLGAPLRAWILGGDVVSSATLVRLYAVHAHLLPLALFGFTAGFLLLRARLGPAGPYDERAPPTPEARERSLARDSYAAIAACAAALLLGLLLPAQLGPAPDPSFATSPDARPEWFFLWINQLLREWPGGAFLPAVLLPTVLLAAAALLPWIGRGRSPHTRKLEVLAVALVVSWMGHLTYKALAQEPAEPAAPDLPAGLEDGDLEERAREVMLRFKCAGCHIIDGEEGGGESGPPLDREGFAELYTEHYFRKKVADPIAFWDATGMRYSPARLKPTPEELETLARWFYAGEPEAPR